MNLAFSGWGWNTEISCGVQEETVCLYAKLVCVLSSPSSVEKVEILSALPGPDSGTDAFRERLLGAMCFIVPSCRTMVADMTRELGDINSANAQARAALAINCKNVHKFPFQVMFARSSLAASLSADIEGTYT